MHPWVPSSIFHMTGILEIVPAGVITGQNVKKLFDFAQQNGFAIPAFNCTSTSTVNACLEAARDAKSPVIIQVSQGGAAYFAGKGLDNKLQQASIAGAIACARYVRQVAELYGVPVISKS